jgi:uncharacterized protein (TIGR01244 family)
MAIRITEHSKNFSASPQISVNDVAEVAQLGFKTIFNNRPDGEGGANQPTSAQIQTAAKKHGLDYVYIPVIPNKEIDQLPTFSAAYAQAEKPVLGFCGTAHRAGVIFKLAREESEKNRSDASPKGLMSWLKNKL